MNYIIKFRCTSNHDLGGTLRFLPEPGEFEAHLSMMQKDLASIDGVSSAEFSGDLELIIKSQLEVKAFKEALASFLRYHHDYLRVEEFRTA